MPRALPLRQLPLRDKQRVPESPPTRYSEIGTGDEEGPAWFDLYQGRGVYNRALCLLRSGSGSALHPNYVTGSRLHSLLHFVQFV